MCLSSEPNPAFFTTGNLHFSEGHAREGLTPLCQDIEVRRLNAAGTKCKVFEVIKTPAPIGSELQTVLSDFSAPKPIKLDPMDFFSHREEILADAARPLGMQRFEH